MKKEFELFDESTMDVEDLQVERDAQLAGVDAIRRARRFGTFYVICEDDKTKKIPPDQTVPYEENLLASAARLDRRIAELQQSQSSAAALNDRPLTNNS
ncbi:MAG TPA: hypothetical protein VH413_03400 [Verrucomicrobiae bacterium]|jgi:hypothetical protein|nr:hypothetical protein [Verrucomicrobiae bacterium]